MYTCKKPFKSAHYGKTYAVGDEVPFNKVWLDEGLIQEGKPESKKETKPQPEPKKKATK